MTTATAFSIATEPVGTLLEPVHDRWAAQVRAFLLPATDVRAAFWSRWGAVRYLSDQFAGRFRLEGAFADELRPLIGPLADSRLSAAREKVERTAATLMAMGRRRGVAMLSAALAQRLLEELGCWWGQLEAATAHLDPDDLPLRAKRHLRLLQAGYALPR
ncbi:hypothetical protein BH24GEM1_BH24GEM1_12590 [soil metagenome]